MIVFALPVHDCTFDSIPNPVVIHPSVNASDAINAVPDCCLKFNDINKHCCFANPDGNHIVSKKEGEKKGSARGSVQGRCDYTTMHGQF
jgi:hypothetical protein